MADYTITKGWQKNYPVHAHATSDLFKRVEPLITPEVLISRFLNGISLRSPVTKKEITNPELQDFIVMAVAQAELELQLDIYPVQYIKKLPFDKSFSETTTMVLDLHVAPVKSIEDASLITASNQNIYTVPPDWLEVANIDKGMLNILPLSVVANQFVATAENFGGVVFLNSLAGYRFIPALWQVTFTSGFDEGRVPMIINQAIGIIAALDILGNLSAQHGSMSASIGFDGISQSQSSPGPQRYAQRISELQAKRFTIKRQIKSKFKGQFLISNL